MKGLVIFSFSESVDNLRFTVGHTIEVRLRWGSYLTSIEIPRHEERDEKCKRYLDAAGSPHSFQLASDAQV